MEFVEREHVASVWPVSNSSSLPLPPTIFLLHSPPPPPTPTHTHAYSEPPLSFPPLPVPSPHALLSLIWLDIGFGKHWRAWSTMLRRLDQLSGFSCAVQQFSLGAFAADRWTALCSCLRQVNLGGLTCSSTPSCIPKPQAHNEVESQHQTPKQKKTNTVGC